MICGAFDHGVEFPDTGGLCCYGSAIYGPERCTCWEPVFDREQGEPKGPLAVAERAAMCDDCAYRPGSFERRDEADEEHLMSLPQSPGTVFWCHKGMRAPSAWRHPSGLTIPADTARDYQPPIHTTEDGRQVPLRADGTAAQICAGWAARRRRSDR